MSAELSMPVKAEVARTLYSKIKWDDVLRSGEISQTFDVGRTSILLFSTCYMSICIPNNATLSPPFFISSIAFTARTGPNQCRGSAG